MIALPVEQLLMGMCHCLPRQPITEDSFTCLKGRVRERDKEFSILQVTPAMATPAGLGQVDGRSQEFSPGLPGG